MLPLVAAVGGLVEVCSGGGGDGRSSRRRSVSHAGGWLPQVPGCVAGERVSLGGSRASAGTASAVARGDAGPEAGERASGPRCATDAGTRSKGTASMGRADRLGKERVCFSVIASSGVYGAALI
jgi:hypothetical protein